MSFSTGAILDQVKSGARNDVLKLPRCCGRSYSSPLEGWPTGYLENVGYSDDEDADVAIKKMRD
jgi:hypothetical protein